MSDDRVLREQNAARGYHEVQEVARLEHEGLRSQGKAITAMRIENFAKSVRYRAGQAQIWGFQARRVNRWKNEISFLTAVPDGLGDVGLRAADGLDGAARRDVGDDVADVLAHALGGNAV